MFVSLPAPHTLRFLINFTQEDPNPATSWKGYFYAVLLFVAAVVQSLLTHQYFHGCFVVGLRMRTGVIAAVYRKVSVYSETLSFNAIHEDMCFCIEETLNVPMIT